MTKTAVLSEKCLSHRNKRSKKNNVIRNQTKSFGERLVLKGSFNKSLSLNNERKRFRNNLFNINIAVTKYNIEIRRT